RWASGVHATVAPAVVVVLGKKHRSGGMLDATGDYGSERCVRIKSARLLPYPLAIAGLDQRRDDDRVLIFGRRADRVCGFLDAAVRTALLGIGQYRRKHTDRCRAARTFDEAVR